MFKTTNHTDSMGQSVWTITHNLGIKPVSDSWVDVNGVLTKILPVSVIHLDDNTLQLTFSTPSVGGVRVAGINVADTLVGAGTIDGEISPPNVAENVPIEYHINTFSPSGYWNDYVDATGATVFTGGGGKINLVLLPASPRFRKVGDDTVHTNDVAFRYPDSVGATNAAVKIDSTWNGASTIMWETAVITTTPSNETFSYFVPVTGSFDPDEIPTPNASDYIVNFHSNGYVQLHDNTWVATSGWNGSNQPTIGMTLAPTNGGQLKFYINGTAAYSIDNVPSGGFPVLAVGENVLLEYNLYTQSVVHQAAYEAASGEALIVGGGGVLDWSMLPTSSTFRTISAPQDNAVAFRHPLGTSNSAATVKGTVGWDGVTAVAWEVQVSTPNFAGARFGYYNQGAAPAFDPDVLDGNYDFASLPGTIIYTASGTVRLGDGTTLIDKTAWTETSLIGMVLTPANGGTLMFFIDGVQVYQVDNSVSTVFTPGGVPMLCVDSTEK